MKKMHLPIVVELDEDGVYIVSCPLFKACRAYGKDIDEALSNLREVIDMCIEEQPPADATRFLGMREIEVSVPKRG